MNRDQRVKKVFRSLTTAGFILAGLTILVSLLQENWATEPETRDFLWGVTVGIRTAFPFMLFFLAYRGYLTMDEYGRTKMLKAAALAFVVVMGFSMAYYPLQAAGKIPELPVWVNWALGFATFSVSMGVQSRT